TAPPGSGADGDAPEAFVEAMRAERFDLAIQMHGGGKATNPFVRSLGARVTAGLCAAGSAPLDRWGRYIYFQHEVTRYLEVVALVGAAPVTIESRIEITPRDLAESTALVAPGTPYAVIHPGATDERRRWTPQRYARLGDRLAAEGLLPVITGDASEAHLVRRVAAAMRTAPLEAAGRLSLGGLAGLIHGASVVIGNDTGPLHLANALDAPSVTLYWIGNLINGAPITRHRHRAIGSWQIDCPVCGVANVDVRCRHDRSFLDRISYEEVEDQVLDVLACAAGARQRVPEAMVSANSASHR
ncbi:MAG TPA: glycosyltransferase family 9 protein, partial [Candidatus Acidoferrum sp.]|nr:glycosyltransferase family 9 protein [Candidatus Acidoferrum sp.]